MPTPPKRPIPLWQWPNILALDAALIASLWQAALASTIDVALSATAHLVLGCSVWLSYTADRLFDVERRDEGRLLSVRHRFAKRHRTILWRIWIGVLIFNLAIATQLTSNQLMQGSVLLLTCLAYTLLNQKLSRRFFPKELCVAWIFAGGVVVLLPENPSITFVGFFAYLCFLNCLIIGKKEMRIDAHLRVRSMASWITDAQLTAMIWIGAILAVFSAAPLKAALATSFILLVLIQAARTRLPTETFRVAADGALLIGPACLLISF